MKKLIEDLETLVIDLADPKKEPDLFMINQVLREIYGLSKNDILIAWGMFLIVIQRMHADPYHKHPADKYLMEMATSFVTRMDTLSQKDKDLRKVYHATLAVAKKAALKVFDQSADSFCLHLGYDLHT